MTTVGELLFLRAAERSAKRTPEDQRVALASTLSLGRQRAAAADVLWSNGHVAEGLRLAAAAFGSVREALDVVAPARDDDDPLEERLRRIGLDKDEAFATAKAAQALRETVMPRLDEQLTPRESELFGRLVKAQRQVQTVLAAAAMTPGQVAWSRRLRLGAVAIVSALIAVAIYALVTVPPGVHATASATWSPQSGLADAAVDGDPETEWMLPDSETGWIDVTISPPERIDTLRLLNGHNGAYNDRAVRSAVIEIHADGVVAQRLTHEWTDLVPRPDWAELEVGVDDVERVRLFVRGFHREGAALAEIDWR